MTQATDRPQQVPTDETDYPSLRQTPANDSPDSGDPHWQDRPDTRANGCEPEPLDGGVEDYYALQEPIARDSQEVARDRYLDDDGDPLTHFEAVGQYLKRRTTDATCREGKGWTNGRRGTAEGQYRQGMAMDRYLLDSFENPTLTMLSLRISPSPQNRLTLLHGLADGVDAALYKLRRRLQKDADAPFSPDEWEYQLVFAGTAERATPHAHILVYTDGDVERHRFADVVEWFVQKCPYAPDDGAGNSPEPDDVGMAQAVSIRGNGEATVPRVDAESCEVRDDVAGTNSQGAVYCLTQLPHLAEVEEMARDELLHSMTLDAYKGSSFRKSVSNDSIPDRYFATATGNLRDDESESDTTSGSAESGASRLTEAEQEFVEAYVAEVGNYSADRICALLEANAGEFEGSDEPNPQRVVPAVRERLRAG